MVRGRRESRLAARDDQNRYWWPCGASPPWHHLVIDSPLDAKPSYGTTPPRPQKTPNKQVESRAEFRHANRETAPLAATWPSSSHATNPS